MSPSSRGNQRGFTLTELAMVIFIIALIAGSGILSISGQRDAEQRRTTETALATIREALVGFAMQNGRLPCPANATQASGSIGSGLEATTGTGSTLTCNCTGASPQCTTDSATGVLPWVTLGLPETDPWGQRYTYQVSRVYARGIGNLNGYCSPEPTALPTQAAFALCTTGKTQVYQAITSLSPLVGTQLTNTDEVPAVVLSHGPNGFGGWQSTGNQAAAGSTDEQINSDADQIFISHPGMDDMVFWISSYVLKNRMITAGKLP